MSLNLLKQRFCAKLCLCLLVSAFYAHGYELADQKVKIAIPDFNVTLPALSQALAQREAKPLPEEFSLAQELRPMLDKGNYRQALSLLSAKKTLSPALTLVKAQLLSQENRFDETLASYDEALKQMPQLVRAHQGKAIILLLQKNYPAAQSALSSAIKYGLHDADAYAQLAYVNLQANDAWSAIGAFQQALMLTPDNKSLRFGLLSALIKTKQTNSALNLIENLLESEPDNTSLWLQRANLALSIDETDMALSSLETAIRLGDKQASNYIIAAQLHLQKGNYSRVDSLLHGSKITFDQEQITGLMPLLAQKQQWNLLDNLLTTYKPTLNKLSGIKKSRYHLYQAQLAGVKNNAKAEKSALAKAISADPTNGQALMTIANIHRAEQNYTAAEQYYARASSLETVKKEAFLGLAQTFLDQQDYNGALKNLVALNKLDPHNEDILRNIASIKRIMQAQR